MKCPGWIQNWHIVACCTYIHFALFGIFRSSGVLYVVLIEHFQVSRREAAWPFSLFSAVNQITGTFAGILVLFLTQRSICFSGSLIAAFGLILCYLAQNIFWINICYGLIYGIGFGVTAILLPAILSERFPEDRAMTIGIAFSGGTFGSMVFPIFVKWLLETYDLKSTFLLLGGIVLNNLVASALLGSSSKTKSAKIKAISFKNLLPSDEQQTWYRKIYQTLCDIMKKWIFYLITLNTIVFFTSLQVFFIVIVDFVRDKGHAESQGIFLLFVFSFADLVARFGLGWITDHHFLERKTVIIIGQVIIGVIYLAYPEVDSLVGLFLMATLHGLALGSTYVLFFVLYAEYFNPEKMTFAISLAFLFSGLFTFACPRLIGIFRDVIGSYEWLFRSYGLFLLGLALCWMVEVKIQAKKSRFSVLAQTDNSNL